MSFLTDNFYTIVIIWIAVAIVSFPFLLRVTQPYGRHTKKGWGPMMDNRLGWIIMEFPSIFLFTVLFLMGDAEKDNFKWGLFAVYFIHYFNRVFIFPLRTKTKRKKMPVIIVLSAIFFNLINGSINGYWLGYLSPSMSLTWYYVVGLIVFISGFIINQDSDRRLINLRKNGDGGYYIPRGGMFRWVSCPNFLGEMMEWIGWAIMCWSLPALSFAIWTATNLIPRALDHHRWYKRTFPEYPKERKAVIPYVL
jgi:hypothetical protein